MTMYRILSGGLHGRYEGPAKDADGKLLQRDLVIYGPATMADGKLRPSHDTDGNLNAGFVEGEENGVVTARDVINLSDAEVKSPSFKGRIQKLESKFVPAEAIKQPQKLAAPISVASKPAAQSQPIAQQKTA